MTEFDRCGLRKKKEKNNCVLFIQLMLKEHWRQGSDARYKLLPINNLVLTFSKNSSTFFVKISYEKEKWTKRRSSEGWKIMG